MLCLPCCDNICLIDRIAVWFDALLADPETVGFIPSVHCVMCIDSSLCNFCHVTTRQGETLQLMGHLCVARCVHTEAQDKHICWGVSGWYQLWAYFLSFIFVLSQAHDCSCLYSEFCIIIFLQRLIQWEQQHGCIGAFFVRQGMDVWFGQLI